MNAFVVGPSPQSNLDRGIGSAFSSPGRFKIDGSEDGFGNLDSPVYPNCGSLAKWESRENRDVKTKGLAFERSADGGTVWGRRFVIRLSGFAGSD